MSVFQRDQLRAGFVKAYSVVNYTESRTIPPRAILPGQYPLLNTPWPIPHWTNPPGTIPLRQYPRAFIPLKITKECR